MHTFWSNGSLKVYGYISPTANVLDKSLCMCNDETRPSSPGRCYCQYQLTFVSFDLGVLIPHPHHYNSTCYLKLYHVLISRSIIFLILSVLSINMAIKHAHTHVHTHTHTHVTLFPNTICCSRYQLKMLIFRVDFQSDNDKCLS